MTSSQLTAEDVLLLLAKGATGPYPLDPVRLMKGAFLVSKRGRRDWQPLFRFVAYDYGPFDVGVYNARDTLAERGLLEVSRGYYDSYGLTADGEERVKALLEEYGEDAGWVRQVGAYVTSRPFDRLLREIYDAYPEYKTRSRLGQ